MTTGEGNTDNRPTFGDLWRQYGKLPPVQRFITRAVLVAVIAVTAALIAGALVVAVRAGIKLSVYLWRVTAW